MRNFSVCFQVTEGGQIKAKPSSVIKEMEELLEEKGLICCICREGYKFHPKKVFITASIFIFSGLSVIRSCSRRLSIVDSFLTYALQRYLVVLNET